MTTPRSSVSGLYAITDSTLLQGRLITAVAEALAGGVRVVQYRDKSADTTRRRQEAAALLLLCRQHQVPLLINDDVALALAIGADGVHLGQGDESLGEARQQLGPGAIIGVTCHDRLDLARAAAADGADYLAFGAMFASTSKPGAQHCPLSVLAEARRFNLPLVAIGGITPDNAKEVIASGADALAVIASLWQSTEITRRAYQFSQEFPTA